MGEIVGRPAPAARHRHMYRVLATWPGGRVTDWYYLTKQSASARRSEFERQGASVQVMESDPVTWSGAPPGYVVDYSDGRCSSQSLGSAGVGRLGISYRCDRTAGHSEPHRAIISLDPAVPHVVWES